MSDHAGSDLAGSDHAGSDHAAAELRIRPVHGLPEFRPGDDVASAIASAAPWLADGDIVVVTSKIISKAEGRIVTAPTDPDARDALRRELVAHEAVRVLAKFNRTLITENRLGIVAAASGVDGSNVDIGEIALLPVDPDASAAGLRAALDELLGVQVAVVITDTMGRAWRNGQIDAAIGAAGLQVIHGYAGTSDRHGNDLKVTEVAIADELASAADLVNGKLRGIPVAVVTGFPTRDDQSTASDLIRRTDDLFWLGADDAIARGRREALRLRKSVREFSSAPVDPELIRRAIAMAATAPAPHHTRPVRFVWLRDPARRRALLDAMRAKWRTDLEGDGLSADRVEKRVHRGDILYRAPEVVIPFWVPDGAHTYRDSVRQSAESTMFTVAAGAAVQALLVALATDGIGSCWIGSTIFAPEVVREVLDLPADWSPLGTVAIGHPTEPLAPRPEPDVWPGLLLER